MYILDKVTSYEQIINRSRFICYLYPINSVEEANEILKQIRKQHYDATHNCYAYILGESGSIARNSDDGEPAGTAGIVIYDILKKNELTNVLAIVSRYFGGIKLGAAGLIRAYGSSVAKALENVNKLKIEKTTALIIEIDYAYYNHIEKNLEEYSQIEKQFTDKIIIKLSIPENKKITLVNELTNLTGGNIKIT
ncbi:MAG: YigZ family protein [Bacilli bacterium]|nr:YigZ family protein [Bacilli bacterium]MDD4076492.1 YigZ family protein [Bacilli bacterium]MDD4387757.1 YigZ family protein [Bacilli bacterium]